MRSVVDRNFLMRRIPVLCLEYHRNFGSCGCFRGKYRTLVGACVGFTCVVFACVVFTCVVFACVVFACVVFTCVVFACVVFTCVVFACVVFACVVFACVVFALMPTCIFAPTLITSK